MRYHGTALCGWGGLTHLHGLLRALLEHETDPWVRSSARRCLPRTER